MVAVALAPARGVDARPAKKKKPQGHKVRIETVPEGAAIYLGDKESGPAGTTPADLSLPAGEHIVILELDGHVPRFETLVIDPDVATTQTFAFELDPAVATLIVEAEPGTALPDGTRVLVDGEDRGEPPLRIEVEVGAHQVQVTAPGKPPFEEWVEVEGGQEHLVEVRGAAGSADVSASTGPTKKRRRPGQRMATARVGAEIGFRRFRYDGARTSNLRKYDANGTPHAVIDLELYPWRRFVANRVLDRISILAGAGYSPVITATNMAGDAVEAYWRSQHAGMRFRPLDRSVGVDVDAEWMHTLYTFRDENNLIVDEVPDVDYHMLRIGLRVVGTSDPVEGWVGVDNRLVLSAGELERRFRGAKVDGFAARAGLAVRLLEGRIEGRAEAHYTRYGWEFDSMEGDAYDADGGTDALFGVILTAGGTF